MPSSNELSRDLRKQVLDAYESSQGFIKITSLFEINHYTVRGIIYKLCRFQMTANLSRTGQPSIFNPQANTLMVNEVFKNTNISLRDLQVTFATDYQSAKWTLKQYYSLRLSLFSFVKKSTLSMGCTYIFTWLYISIESQKKIQGIRFQFQTAFEIILLETLYLKSTGIIE